MLLLTLITLLQNPSPVQDSVTYRLLTAEDARAATSGDLQLLLDAAHGSDTAAQRRALRALSRLERPALLPHFIRALASPLATIRETAAQGIAQAHHRGPDGATAAARALTAHAAHAAREGESAVLAAVVRALGRLRLVPGAEFTSRDSLVIVQLQAEDRTLRAAAARAAWDRLRQPAPHSALPPPTSLVQSLRGTLTSASTRETRRDALQALAAAGAVNLPDLSRAAGDPDPEIRRLALRLTRTLPSLTEAHRALLRQGLKDENLTVRHEALSGYGRHLQATEGCSPVRMALTDPSGHLQLLAIDLLRGFCPTDTRVGETLAAIAAEPLTRAAWHRPVHALRSLGVVDSGAARRALPRFVQSNIWWVRMHSADAATTLGAVDVLRRLATDSVDNVREAAIRGLAALQGHEADEVIAHQLRRRDGQLLLTAAGLLRASPRGRRLLDALFDALARSTAAQAETSRDPRLGLLARIEEFGSPAESTRLSPWLTDFDPVVAGEAARILTEWTGRPSRAAPRPLPEPALPSPEALRTMRQATIEMEDGGVIELALDPDGAPTNVARFVSMARRGVLAGRTFHRVVPNFVLQGGSPGANEYAGEPDFTRDEVGGHHERGTVGISTRGRDTGDGQIFLNLVDNARLDFDYTVIGWVTSGWDVMDRILEGARIRRVTATPETNE